MEWWTIAVSLTKHKNQFFSSCDWKAVVSSIMCQLFFHRICDDLGCWEGIMKTQIDLMVESEDFFYICSIMGALLWMNIPFLRGVLSITFIIIPQLQNLSPRHPCGKSQPTPFIFVSKFREIHFPRSRLLWEKSPAPSTWGLTLHLWQWQCQYIRAFIRVQSYIRITQILHNSSSQDSAMTLHLRSLSLSQWQMQARQRFVESLTANKGK